VGGGEERERERERERSGSGRQRESRSPCLNPQFHGYPRIERSVTRLDRFRDIFLARHAKPSRVAKSNRKSGQSWDRNRESRGSRCAHVCLHVCVRARDVCRRSFR